MRIEFGIFDHVEAQRAKPVGQIYEERIASLKRAEAGGFYAFHLAEHHGHTLSTAPTRGGLPCRVGAGDDHAQADPHGGLPAAAQPGAVVRGPGHG